MNWKLVLTVFVAALIASLTVALIVKHKVYAADGTTLTGVSKPALSTKPKAAVKP